MRIRIIFIKVLGRFQDLAILYLAKSIKPEVHSVKVMRARDI